MQTETKVRRLKLIGGPLGLGAVAKWLSRGFHDHKVRVGFTAEPNAAAVPMSNAEAFTITSAYGTLLADRGTSFGDVRELPYDKERIKQALIHRIRAGKDPKERELLRAAYVMLADFQPGLGNRRSAELTADDLKDPSKAAARFLANGDDFTRVSREVAAEAGSLMADLKELDLPEQPIEPDLRPVHSSVRLVSQ
jgi:hypothetical protein